MTPAPTAKEASKALGQIPALQQGELIEYTLYYRHGQQTSSEFLRFTFPSSDMKLVVERAKHHCETMGYRFVRVKPSMTNLDKAENVLTNRSEY
jgi:hypothetical protein